ncbi:MAG: molybdopterin-dependent oxidoreductase, partial [Deltaproteobacteria bacterium]|nr:molybdopterin-dependent oxidoreductase [Deltaproteobacteria bacterium]
ASLSALCGAIDIEGGEPWNKDIQVNQLNPLSKRQFREMQPAGYAHYPLFYDVMGKCHSLPGIDYMLGKGTYPIEGLIFSGTNPVLTNPNANKVAKAFANLDLLVARDLFMTESAKLAHYIIPAASFLERSELHIYPDAQRVGLSRKVTWHIGWALVMRIFRGKTRRRSTAGCWNLPGFPLKSWRQTRRVLSTIKKMSVKNIKPVRSQPLPESSSSPRSIWISLAVPLIRFTHHLDTWQPRHPSFPYG